MIRSKIMMWVGAGAKAPTKGSHVIVDFLSYHTHPARVPTRLRTNFY
jgi:hypothetical protein